MQNNKSKGFRSFLKEKGYYIVLLLCAVAVATSGYFLLRPNSAQKPPKEESVQNSEDASQATTKTPTKKPGNAADVIATDGTEPSKATEPTRLETQKPVSGEELNAFAGDFLAFNQTTRDWRTHEGVDLSAALGQEVQAAAEGTVYAVYEDESLGMTVVVRHPNGYTTHYSNLDKAVAVRVGDAVAAGMVLGKVGQTACTETATAPHLHFAVYENNVPVDPEEFFK